MIHHRARIKLFINTISKMKRIRLRKILIDLWKVLYTVKTTECFGKQERDILQERQKEYELHNIFYKSFGVCRPKAEDPCFRPQGTLA